MLNHSQQNQTANANVNAISYRDPSGFIFKKDDILYRQVNVIFREHYDHFISSGCYEMLIKKGWLLPHTTIRENILQHKEWYLTLQPEKIPFISYAYEWSFDMLKDAALLTLQILKEALRFGLVLKDATPNNIQWYNGRLIFIDSLSFEKYREEEPWIAYRQFCENFLAPLMLMHYRKQSLQPMLLAYPEGIPLSLASSLLPGRTKLSLHPYLHIHLHARLSQKKPAGPEKKYVFSGNKLLNLVASLESLVHRMNLPDQNSNWSGYYEEAATRNDYLEQKKKIIGNWLDEITGIEQAADLGANEGAFSMLLADRNIPTLAADFDPWCINRLYRSIKEKSVNKIQPLVIDLSNPSPGTGVNNEERTSFIDRTRVDLALALAVIHHLSIGKNIPFELITGLLQKICRRLIIEFIPKQDEKVRVMLSQKKDIYSHYTVSNFESAFHAHFSIIKKEMIGDSDRVLYLMEKR